jgi:hypothetical protein
MIFLPFVAYPTCRSTSGSRTRSNTQSWFSPPVLVVECGCCSEYHLADYFGDCRDDAHRFTSDQLDHQYGLDGWYEQ